MAAGGLPIPNKTNATDVLKAAIEMRNYIEAQRIKKIALNQPILILELVFIQDQW